MISGDKLWFKVARLSVRASKVPFPITDTMLEILKMLLTEEQAKFIVKTFKKKRHPISQIKSKTDLDDESLDKMLDDLTHIGAIIGFPNRTTGEMVYSMTPIFPGLIELSLMRGETGEFQKKLARMWDVVYNELCQAVQKEYDVAISLLKGNFVLDRIVPVEEEIDPGQEVVLPMEELSKIIDSYDDYAVAVCYCRHRNDLIDQPCKVTKNRKNCIILGRTAQYLTTRGFAETITKEQAMKILKETEDDGLIHKAFHHDLNLNKELDGICNCCKCCCGTFLNHYNGGLPVMSLATYIARVSENDCVGCETCVDICHLEAIELEDALAIINDDRCVGCGLCAHHCPEKAIKLERTGPRNVFIPPPRIKN